MTPPPARPATAAGSRRGRSPRDEASPSTRRRRSPRGEGDQLRDELLDAAEGLLVDHGSMEAVSVRAIADAVGVTPPSLYLHFADKDELFFAVCERRFADFEKVLREARDAAGDDPTDQLRAMGRAYVRYGVERAEHYEILFGPKAQDVVGDHALEDTAGMRALAMLVETVQAAIDSGALRDDDAWVTALTIWSGVHGAVMLLLSKDALADQLPLPDADQLGDHVCDTLMRGLAAG